MGATRVPERSLRSIDLMHSSGSHNGRYGGKDLFERSDSHPFSWPGEEAPNGRSHPISAFAPHHPHSLT